MKLLSRNAHNAAPSGTPVHSCDTPTTRWVTPFTSVVVYSKKWLRDGIQANSATGSYIMNDWTRSHIESLASRSAPSPARKVLENQALSHRAGKPS
eukprot:CAMPEP_0181200918 /NCGR_PEP_ID=MMETSP1096-20121128/18030_1 /TAXON_ID=156174 ORGANISM="Chrysochromulina ericina, Strain CCMP281" /NCGR_SAMPLE_ID=MMETSP1096 /ASSEMBLY_ACC=CAM_ASM_000453 /LENGTH=95 /DNA_ID=CAMNT_0023291327 /DNA_START=782 /DNA_END=1066 /DNA_ORIENTATION=+